MTICLEGITRQAVFKLEGGALKRTSLEVSDDGTANGDVFTVVSGDGRESWMVLKGKPEDIQFNAEARLMYDNETVRPNNRFGDIIMHNAFGRSIPEDVKYKKIKAVSLPWKIENDRLIGGRILTAEYFNKDGKWNQIHIRDIDAYENEPPQVQQGYMKIQSPSGDTYYAKSSIIVRPEAHVRPQKAPDPPRVVATAEGTKTPPKRNVRPPRV